MEDCVFPVRVMRCLGTQAVVGELRGAPPLHAADADVDVVSGAFFGSCASRSCVPVTNAAGGLNPDFEVGTIVAMHDHLSMPSLTVRADTSLSQKIREPR